MSATSQGFAHYHDAIFLQTHGKISNPKTWAKRLPGFINEDFPVPNHITITAADPTLMSCEKCARKYTALSPHAAVSFLDSHRYCGAFRVKVLICPLCGASEDPSHPTCRFCETPMTGDETRAEYYSTLLEQKMDFFVERAGTVTGTISAGSLREALRAARGWYPYEEITIRCEGIGSWTTTHVCK